MKSRLTLQQVEWALQIIKKLSEDADYKPTKTHLTLLARYREENPRNYPAFFCESIGVIYAVNKESADKQEARILKKRNNFTANWDVTKEDLEAAQPDFKGKYTDGI